MGGGAVGRGSEGAGGVSSTDVVRTCRMYMAGGLFGLLDDVAALAKAAAASIDDVGLAASKASAKAAGVVVDDTAVTPTYVQGLAAERELPIIKRIARGSLKNKLLFILPAALLLSQFVPILVEIVLLPETHGSARNLNARRCRNTQ